MQKIIVSVLILFWSLQRPLPFINQYHKIMIAPCQCQYMAHNISQLKYKRYDPHRIREVATHNLVTSAYVSQLNSLTILIILHPHLRADYHKNSQWSITQLHVASYYPRSHSSPVVLSDSLARGFCLRLVGQCRKQPTLVQPVPYLMRFVRTYLQAVLAKAWLVTKNPTQKVQNNPLVIGSFLGLIIILKSAKF